MNCQQQLPTMCLFFFLEHKQKRKYNVTEIEHFLHGESPGDQRPVNRL